MTGIIGPVVEAWDELRIHKVRILLALAAVTIAVCALTVAVALGQMITSYSRAAMEQQSGRPATYQIDAWPSTTGPLDAGKVNAAYLDFVRRNQITFYSRVSSAQITARLPHGMLQLRSIAVDPGYFKMKLFTVDQGRVFTLADDANLAPAVIINGAAWQAMGAPPLSSRPTLQLLGTNPTTAVVVGIKNQITWPGEEPMVLLGYEALQAIIPPGSTSTSQLSLQVWVPPDQAHTVEALIDRDLTAAISGANVTYARQDIARLEDSIRPLRIGVIGAASLLLLLGAMGLLNLSLVTVKARVREIGIRRSFGATAARVFFAVILESIVATALAGAAGVVGAAAIVRLMPMDWLTQGAPPVALPGFPVGAALVGIGAATVVGAIAGAIPALMATRVRVIDAIRY